MGCFNTLRCRHLTYKTCSWCSIKYSIYTLSQKNLCTQKEMSINQETTHEYNVWGDKQMIKNSEQKINLLRSHGMKKDKNQWVIKPYLIAIQAETLNDFELIRSFIILVDNYALVFTIRQIIYQYFRRGEVHSHQVPHVFYWRDVWWLGRLWEYVIKLRTWKNRWESHAVSGQMLSCC